MTVFIKILMSTFGLAGFIKGLFDSINYSTSFLFIHGFGWTLATKQPSATAPYLAQSLKKPQIESRKAVIAILRTQFISVLGNLTLVFPICFAISWILYFYGAPLMSADESLKAVKSSNVLSAAPLFAVFTGTLLFLSSLIAGWFENWVAIHKISERFKNHQNLLHLFGKEKIKNFSMRFKQNANPYASSVSLGFLLGLAPQFIKFMGLPLEVRHITLATGNFAVALPLVLEQGLSAYDYTNAVCGLLIIGIINIIVSFTLALLLAAFSTKIKLADLWSLLKWGLILVLTKPWLLFVPEKQIDSRIDL